MLGKSIAQGIPKWPLNWLIRVIHSPSSLQNSALISWWSPTFDLGFLVFPNSSSAFILNSSQYSWYFFLLTGAPSSPSHQRNKYNCTTLWNDIYAYDDRLRPSGQVCSHSPPGYPHVFTISVSHHGTFVHIHVMICIWCIPPASAGTSLLSCRALWLRLIPTSVSPRQLILRNKLARQITGLPRFSTLEFE